MRMPCIVYGEKKDNKTNQISSIASSRGLMVRIMDSELEGRGWVRFPSVTVGFFQPKVGSYPEWACYGPNGKTEATQSSLIRFTDAPVRV